MTLQKQIHDLQQEIGRPRKSRGEKVKAAAIRFEEAFREHSFDSREFKQWLARDPDMNKYQNNPSEARTRLQAAGFRDDLEHPFEIKRLGKSQWELRPVEKIFFTQDIPNELAEKVSRVERQIQKHLQATDFNGQSPFAKMAIVTFYRQFKHSKAHALTSISNLTDLALQWEEGDYLRLEAHQEND